MFVSGQGATFLVGGSIEPEVTFHPCPPSSYRTGGPKKGSHGDGCPVELIEGSCT